MELQSSGSDATKRVVTTPSKLLPTLPQYVSCLSDEIRHVLFGTLTANRPNMTGTWVCLPTTPQDTTELRYVLHHTFPEPFHSGPYSSQR